MAIGGKGFLGGVVWGVAIYLIIQYVWPKVKSAMSSGGGGLFGSEAVAFPAAEGVGGGGVTQSGFPSGSLPWQGNRPDWNAFTQCHENCRQSCMNMTPGLSQHNYIGPAQPMPMPPTPAGIPAKPAFAVSHANLANYDPYNLQANRLLSLGYSPYLGLGRYGN